MESIDGRYICKICNKKYSSYKSLWNHNKKYHNSVFIINTQNSSNITQNSSNITQNSSTNTLHKKICIYCKKYFSRIDNLKRHQNKCKEKDDTHNDKINKIIETKLDEFKNNIFDILQKNAKIHPKTLQKINKELINNTTNNNSNNTINNINNISIIINIINK